MKEQIEIILEKHDRMVIFNYASCADEIIELIATEVERRVREWHEQFKCSDSQDEDDERPTNQEKFDGNYLPDIEF